jgi:hypothetical protein
MNLLASLRYPAGRFDDISTSWSCSDGMLHHSWRRPMHCGHRRGFGCAIVKGRSFGGFTAEGERVLASAQRMLYERAPAGPHVAGKPLAAGASGGTHSHSCRGAVFSRCTQGTLGILPVGVPHGSSDGTGA